MRLSFEILAFAMLMACAVLAAPAVAADAPTTVTLTLKDHKFEPAEITVPAGQKFRIELSNQDSTAEEFDSDDLHAEKDVKPHGKVVIQVGALKPGTYHFMGELHKETAQGTVVATQP
jgi:plastocyanin